jgi:flagellar biosynthetic protein FlhB
VADPSQSDEERALEATERRLEKAREEGQYPQSRDLTTLLVLTVLAGFVLTLGSSLWKHWIELVRQGLQFPAIDQWQDHLIAWSTGPLLGMFLTLLGLLLPIWLISTLAPLALVRFRPVFAWQFNMSRLDPLAGLGRMFSLQTLADLLKNLMKVILIYGIGILYLLSLFSGLHLLAGEDLKQALLHAVTIVRDGFIFLLIPTLGVAALDVFLQWYNFKKRMRMSQQELKEEMKEAEGSPEVRARLRQRQRQIATSRMMSALEKADVILVNPEHYAVALRYDSQTMIAPVVVAKGLDDLALKIQEIGREFEVPIARIPPLARLMHQRLKVGEAVPTQLFEAVAKVLAWAYEFKASEGDAAPPDVGPLPSELFKPEAKQPQG